MTTAARPTFTPAKGGREQGGTRVHAPSMQYAARDQPGHTQLKLRRTGQTTKDEIKERDLRKELEERERKHFLKQKGQEEGLDEEEIQQIENKKKEEQLLLTAKESSKNIDADDSDDSDEEESSDGEENNSSSDNESSDDDDDDTAELMRELEKIKKERAEEQARQEAQHAFDEQQAKEEEMKFGNPLVNKQSGSSGATAAAAADFNVKKRWYEDTVFKNQAKGEPQKKKRFINDTIRSDFHKKFLSKYIK